MEPRAGTPEALRASRVRLVAACVLLVGLALVQDPGFLVPDTKFDLVEAPVDFLGRALHLWDQEGAFGQLQNQAYGYLWPMGPFFVLGDLLQVPGWVVQRLWLALVLVVAFTGAAKVCRALGVRSDLAVLTAGFAFALSPRMLTTLGPISIEAWPSALAPWVLLPLVHGSRAGSPRRWAALSALAVACVGGVNAAATFAVVPVAAIWLLTRTPGPRRRALVLWWPAFTLLATLWWLVPLFVMGRYSPPFLDYIETTTVTTFPTTLFDTLRGTSNWVPYLDSGSRAGNDLISTPYLVLNSGVVLMVGLAGLLHRRTPERGFLTLCVLTGVLMVSAGHAGVVEGWFAGDVRMLLDGVLSPLRNVHKFDVVLRLPLVVGLAFVIDRAVRPDEHTAPSPRPDGSSLQAGGQKVALVGMVVLAVAGSVLPAALGRITPAGATLDVPQYWQQTADWLAEHDTGEGTALVVPGSQFASYVWGSPRDEPLQFYGGAPWAVRNVIPLAPEGNIRMLDEVERWLAQGEGSEGFTTYLRRAGVQYVVVRNDLRPSDDVPLPAVVHQSLARAGLDRVAGFGPLVGGDATLEGDDDDRLVVNGGWQAVYPAVEVFEVPGNTRRAVSAGSPPVVVGGPEDLADLADLDVVGDAPVRLAADLRDDEVEAGPGTAVVLTDGLRARERFFARIHDGYSAVLTPGDVRGSGNPVRDYLLDVDDRWSTTARLEGARTLSASSSASDSTAEGGSRRGDLPYAAVDRSRSSEWVSQSGRAETTWWQIGLDEPVEGTSVQLVGGASAAENQEVRVVTDTGASEVVDVGPGQTVAVRLPDGPTTRLRVEDASGVVGRRLALAEVSVPGVVVERRLVTPLLPDSWGAPDVVVLRSDADARTGCVEVGRDVRCVEDEVRASEEPRSLDRVVTLPESAAYRPDVQVRPRGGGALNRLVLSGQPVRISASTQAVPDPRGGPVAAVDGDPGTSWLASVDDLRPTLSLRWLGARQLDGISLSLDEQTAARFPTRVRLTWPGGVRDVELADGQASFPPVVTDQLQVSVEAADDTVDVGFDAQRSDVGVGIGELELSGLPYLPLGLSADQRSTACGVGPDVSIDGRRYQTSVAYSPLLLLRGALSRATVCAAGSARAQSGTVSAVALGAGESVVTVSGNRAFASASLVLRRLGAEPSSSGTGPAQEGGDAVRRTLTPSGGAALVELRQNANEGWVATQDGKRLEPVVLDGWKQGWLLRDDGTVTADFQPDRTYRFGLAVGVGALGLLLLVLVLLRRGGGDGPAGLHGRGLPRWLALPVAAAAAGLTAGWVGVGLAAGTVVLCVLAARRSATTWPEVAPWLLGGTAFAASLWYAVRPWGDPTGWGGEAAWTSYVLVLPLTALVWLGTEAGRSQSPFRRRAGRSRSR